MELALDFSPEKNIPKIDPHNSPIKQITIITINATHPPAIIALISAFVAAIIALTVDIVALIANLTP